MAPKRVWRLVWREFACIGFDPRKSDEVFAERGFDLAFIARMFPSYVLEREDTRPYPETRYQAIGALLGKLYVAVYGRSGKIGWLITACDADTELRMVWHELR